MYTKSILLGILYFFFIHTGFSQSDTLIAKELPDEIKSVIERYNEETFIEDTTAKEKEIGLELDGLIINETISKAGNDFYNQFRKKWDIPGDIKNYTIYISEMPMPGRGNLVSIKINYDEIFQNRISPRMEVIESLADHALSISEQYLVRQQEMEQQLESEDMSGTGIY
ncbi:MAG: CsgE family curli-type amyloid fiber assembly protein [Bacteroidales bacterium]